MASPRIEAFALFSLTTGAPLPGQLAFMAFETYKDTDGNNLAQPAITEIGGGWYQFTVTSADPAKGVVYILDCGVSSNPRRIYRYMRPEDWASDDVPAILSLSNSIKAHQQGKWEIPTAGPDAYRMVFYQLDGVTVLAKYDLTNALGNPALTGVTKRTPV